MRHDVHFVDQLAAPQSQTIGRMVELAALEPNPQQPRREIGDLTDLVASIKEKGILEPILVRKLGAGYQIIAGERRFHAAKAAGLAQVPCIELEVDERGVLEISLIENLQRRDLDPFEEGDAIRELCDRFSYTHEKIAQKLGKARTSITEILSISGIPSELREVCRRADISSKSLLVEIARQPTPELMWEFVDRIAKDRLTRDDARKLRALPPPEESGSENGSDKSSKGGFVLKLKIEKVPGTLHLRFAQAHVRKSEILAALNELIAQVEGSSEFAD
jgi:ParB family transcriptional regulator, chromosome partitioning protein